MAKISRSNIVNLGGKKGEIRMHMMLTIYGSSPLKGRQTPFTLYKAKDCARSWGYFIATPGAVGQLSNVDNSQKI